MTRKYGGSFPSLTSIRDGHSTFLCIVERAALDSHILNVDLTKKKYVGNLPMVVQLSFVKGEEVIVEDFFL